MKFSENQGIEIDATVKELLEVAVKREGSQNKLAQQMGVPAQNVQNWRGLGNRKGEYILWEQWEKIKPYFTSRGLIDGSDPRWMTPKEMRERLLSANSDLSADERRVFAEAVEDCAGGR